MQSSRKIAVAGATGRVGHHTVDALRESGHEVVEVSRSNGVDVITGEGLADALTGVEGVVDAATGPSPEQDPATRFFTTAARNLQDAARRADVERIVVVSIIGADAFAGGYGAAKIAHERTMLAGPVPVRVVRAAQFHEFVPQMMEWGAQGDVTYVPKMRTQLVAAQAVGEILARLAADPDASPRRRPSRPISRSPGRGRRTSSRSRSSSPSRPGWTRGSRPATTPTIPTPTSTSRELCCPARTPHSPGRRSGTG